MKNGKLKHIDLFSGIGGFALAADRVFGNIEHTFVEWEPFCQAVLRKHWSDAEVHGDIRAFVADAKRVDAHGERSEKGRNKLGSTTSDKDVFLITGGFPCQPFSQAGRRQGTADDRYLWPAMFEAITLFRPEWVIAENVAGLVTWNEGLVLETVCTDLESEGYEVQPFVIPACAVGAPHRRDRIWIIAHAEGHRGNGEVLTGERKKISSTDKSDSHASDSTGKRGQQLTEQQATRQYAGRNREGSNERRGWSEDWPEVAARLCTLDDGLPRGLVRPKGWRNAALKAAGNAIVPQVAERIMRGIAETYS